MNFGQRLKTAINSFSKTSNSFTGSNDFLKNGNRNKMMSDWTSVSMSDEDFYTGYSYAAINNRANKTSQVAMKYLKTTANKTILDSYKKKEETLVHPYLALIEDSVEYSEYDFWYDISTYLDLEGISYILVTRTVEGDRVGTAQEFEVLNPYEIRRIRDKNTLDIGGYVETRDGMVREISPKQMIEIRKLNPFSRDSSFAMTDAAKDSQFTLKQAGDYTRHSLKNNQSAPGIISTDVMLEPEQFKNFVSRITNQDKGMPIFGNGSGAVTWDSMQIDLDKASLNSINEINRSTLFAVSGMSKTSMGIEESGTTRDVSKTQTDNLIENHIMPQIQKVIDALNLDYKRYSPKEYANNKMLIVLDNPLGKDKDVESKEVTIAGDKIKLRQDLIALGYTIELASKYANGEIELDELGLPTEEAKQIEAKTKEEPKPKVDDSKKEDEQAVEDAKAENAYLKELISFLVQKRKDRAKLVTVDNVEDKKSNNAIQDTLPVINQVNIIEDQQNALKSTINKIQADIIKSVLTRVTKNAFDEQDDIILASDREESESDLRKQLVIFYTALFLIYGPQLFTKRKSEFKDAKGTKFLLTPAIKSTIEDFAAKASKSHIDTILNDLLDTSNMAYDQSVSDTVLELLKESGKKEADKAIYDLARKKALEGEGRARIITAIKKEYQDISTTRANTIARTETQRAFNQSQYQADVQFLNDNDLMGRAYKQWKTRSAEPCQYCIDLSKEPPIPFDNNFRDLGDELSYIYTKKDGSKVKRSLQVDYEELSAGNAHVNCGCVYILIIKDSSGKFIQSIDSNIEEFERVLNISYNPYRDSVGRFASGPSASGKMDYGNAPASISSKYLADTYGTDIYNGQESNSISSYAKLEYSDINSALRKGKGKIVDSEFENKANIKNVAAIDSAMKKVSLKDNTVVYRGAANKRNQKFNIGQTFVDPGFSSTSLSSTSAEGFLGDGDNVPYVMKITVPKGTNAVMPGLNTGASKSTAHESEILLPRNTKYKINNITTKQDSLGYDYIAMDVEVIK